SALFTPIRRPPVSTPLSLHDALPILFKRLTMTASTLRARPVEFKGAIADSLHQRVWPLLESGTLSPPAPRVFEPAEIEDAGRGRDRKSTRLNSSHVKISYAVFCLKKK